LSEQQVILVTGASSGIGKASARLFAAEGFLVFGASRRAPTGLDSVAAISMDVRDDRSVTEGVARVLRETGRIDVLLNCAGIVTTGPAEEMPMDEFTDQIETNLLGTVRTCRAVLPGMRARKHGLIVNISSIAGLMGLPFQTGYCASKHAIEGYSEALQMETRKYGVKVVVVNPGDVHTEVTQNRLHSRGMGADSVYRPAFEAAMKIQDDNEIHGWDVERIAAVMLKIATSRSPRYRFVEGPLVEKFAVWARPLLPERMFLKFVGQFAGVK
jgi:NAD(P)-dependent dehydrogenase (short-subunit alcohol dehydrogenase family)